MGRIPIKIEKIKVEDRPNRHLQQNDINETVKYLFKLEEKGQLWAKTFICDRKDLLALREEIDNLITATTTGDILKIPNEQAEIVDKNYKTDPFCQNCNYKLTFHCKTCLFVLQSPLERQLYLALTSAYIEFHVQYALNWQGQNISIEGKKFGDANNNFKEVLTIVDFYIENSRIKLCVYTDGHTYHERSEEQAQRDRNIDRKLQELGFRVLRYTGKEVKENIESIVNDIKKWMN